MSELSKLPGDSPPRLHSEDQFGPQREFWWNKDFLQLMARRWRLNEASPLADVGCGVGHWSRLLYPFLRRPAALVEVDREPRWVAEAEQRFRQAFPDADPGLITFVQGDATRIPLPDDEFDVVTCQKSDRATALFPPYETPAQRAALDQQWQWRNAGADPFDREELRRLCLGDGGTEEFFERADAELERKHARCEQALAAGTFHAASGGVTHLVSGRKKATR